MPTVLLIGSTESQWRDGVRPHLEGAGLAVVTNENRSGWGALSALAPARSLVPLVEHDLGLIESADAVLWHLGTPSKTALAELGILSAQVHRRMVVAHVESNVGARRYCKALCLATGVRWAPSWDRAVELLVRALVVEKRRT
jgi:hypothetical protein